VRQGIMKKRILTFIFPLFALAVSANGPVVTNVTANQQNDLVVITYNLSHPNSLPCEISVEVSTDGGVSYAILPAALSGDIGTIAAPAAGADHQTDWQFGLDGIGSGDNYRVKVIADDLQGQIPETSSWSLAAPSIPQLASIPLDSPYLTFIWTNTSLPTPRGTR